MVTDEKTVYNQKVLKYINRCMRFKNKMPKAIAVNGVYLTLFI